MVDHPCGDTITRTHGAPQQSRIGMFEKWKLGQVAYNAFAWARDVAQSIDPDAAIRILFKVVEIERERRGVPGVLKVGELLDWFRANYPASSSVGVVAGYAKTLVALLNAIGVFKRSGKPA